MKQAKLIVLELVLSVIFLGACGKGGAGNENAQAAGGTGASGGASANGTGGVGVAGGSAASVGGAATLGSLGGFSTRGNGGSQPGNLAGADGLPPAFLDFCFAYCQTESAVPCAQAPTAADCQTRTCLDLPRLDVCKSQYAVFMACFTALGPSAFTCLANGRVVNKPEPCSVERISLATCTNK